MSNFQLNNIFNVKQTFSFVFNGSGKWAYLNLLLSLVNGALPLLVIYLMKMIIDSTTHAVLADNKSQEFYGILTLIIITGIVSVIMEISSNYSTLAREQMAMAAGDHAFDILHKKSVELDLEYYESPEYHDLLYRARTEAPFRPTRIVNNAIQIIQNIISIILTAGMLFYLHWSIAVVMIFATVPGILIRMRYAGNLYKWSRRSTPSERKSRYYNYILTGEKFVKEIRIYGLGDFLSKKFSEIRKQLRKERLLIIIKKTNVEVITQVSAAIAIFGSYIFIVHQAIFGKITIGDMVLFFLAFQKGLSFLRDVLAGLAGLYEDNMFLSDFFKFLSLKPKITDILNPEKIPVPIAKGIHLNNVSFQYPGTEKMVLNNISLNIKSGETVAFVGDNGAGKTTLIKLICRLYDPVEGKLCIDNVDLKNFKISDLRKQISVMFQDFSQYNITLRENVKFGNIDGNISDEKLDEAVKKAGLENVLNSMPLKYDTVLGTVFEKSRELSIGEWQKVALARAYLGNSQIIILDEPTSSMDTFAENEFYENFKKLSENKTAIIVSHRFSTVKMADKIFVLENGSIVESGSHDDLIKLNGKYSVMFNMQANKYQ